jgi:predicted ester cyclase
MATEIKALARKTIEEIFDRGHPSYLMDVSELSYVGHDPTSERSISLQDAKDLAASFREGFPDLRCHVLDAVAEGNLVTCRWKMSGTHQGTFLGFTPSGRHVEFEGMTEMRFHGLRLAEQWTLYDVLGILRQISVLPSIAELAENQQRIEAAKVFPGEGGEPGRWS